MCVNCEGSGYEKGFEQGANAGEKSEREAVLAFLKQSRDVFKRGTNSWDYLDAFVKSIEWGKHREGENK